MKHFVVMMDEHGDTLDQMGPYFSHGAALAISGRFNEAASRRRLPMFRGKVIGGFEVVSEKALS